MTSSLTPTKGQRTRAQIVRRSAELMNRQGYLYAPMAAVVQATGIQKGGLYRHFESRQALALEALDYAVTHIRERLLGAMQGHTHACDRLLAMLDAYDFDEADAGSVPFVGGCPIMNSAIESDHADESLRVRARAAMQGWHDLLARIVAVGLRNGEIRAGVDPGETASAFIACIEGGVMLAHLYGDAAHLRSVRRHLENYIEDRLRPPYAEGKES
jgi:TetR/AcrR family transcriptional regulator, transcriptional repressor for nem operon